MTQRSFLTASFLQPVVCVTGNARPAQVQSYRDAGFDDIAIKPYDFKKLSILIEKLAGR